MQDRDRSGREPVGLRLNGVQVAAGALAAVSSAVAASYLSVGGTIFGAAIGSVVTTTAGAVYGHYLDRTHARLRRTFASSVANLSGPGRSAPALEELGRDTGHGTGRDAGRDPGRYPSRDAGGEGHAEAGETGWRRWQRWAPACGLAVLVFMTALGGITAFESATGRPLHATVRGEDGSGTTVGRFADNAVSPDGSPTRGQDPTEKPTAPADGSSPSPEQPTPDQPGEPTSQEPQPPQEQSGGQPDVPTR